MNKIRHWGWEGLKFIVASVIKGVVIWAFILPYFEAKSFNDCTGGNASYFTALTTELRVENCDRGDK
jgi:hypothetical protein